MNKGIRTNTIQFVLIIAALLWVAWPVGNPQRGMLQIPTEPHFPDLSTIQTKIASLNKIVSEVKQSQITSKNQCKEIFNNIQDLNIKLDTILLESERKIDHIATVLSEKAILQSRSIVTSLSKQLAIKKEETHEYLRRLEAKLATMDTVSPVEPERIFSLLKPKKKKLTPSEKISKLNALARDFVVNYEGHNPKAKRKWNIVWETAIEDGGAPNSIANSKLISVLIGMQGKGSIKNKNIYNACRLFLKHADDRLQLPGIVLNEVIKNNDNTSYYGIVTFIKDGMIK